MELERLTTMAEAILFASGDPVETGRLALTLKVSEKEIVPIMEHLQERYTKTDSALQVLRLSKAWQLGTRPEFAFVIREAMEKKRMQPLSNASMETLTIIAYNQPVSKSFVERVRGIDSSSVVNSLVDKGLLEEAGRIDVPGHPIGYKTPTPNRKTNSLENWKPIPKWQAVRQSQNPFRKVRRMQHESIFNHSLDITDTDNFSVSFRDCDFVQLLGRSFGMEC